MALQFQLTKTLLMLGLFLSVACSCGAASPPATDLMKFLPEGSDFVMSIDLKKVLAGPMVNEEPFKSKIAKVKDVPMFKKLIEAGIDPFTNLNTIVLAAKIDRLDFAVILAGSFDAATVAEKIKADTKYVSLFSSDSITNKQLAARIEADMKNDKEGVEVLGTGMIAVGSRAAVASAKTGNGLDASPEIKGLFSLADNNKPIFAVGLIPAALLAGVQVPEVTNIKSTAFSVDASSDIAISAMVRFVSADTAASFDRFIDFVRHDQLPIGKVPGEILKALKTEVKGTDLTVTLTLTAAQVKEALGE